jgi:hypothetical protein
MQNTVHVRWNLLLHDMPYLGFESISNEYIYGIEPASTRQNALLAGIFPFLYDV